MCQSDRQSLLAAAAAAVAVAARARRRRVVDFASQMRTVSRLMETNLADNALLAAVPHSAPSPLSPSRSLDLVRDPVEYLIRAAIAERKIKEN